MKNDAGEVVASLTMTGLFTRFQGKELKQKIEDTLLMANRISEELGYKVDLKK